MKKKFAKYFACSSKSIFLIISLIVGFVALNFYANSYSAMLLQQDIEVCRQSINDHYSNYILEIKQRFAVAFDLEKKTALADIRANMPLYIERLQNGEIKGDIISEVKAGYIERMNAVAKPFKEEFLKKKEIVTKAWNNCSVDPEIDFNLDDVAIDNFNPTTDSLGQASNGNTNCPAVICIEAPKGCTYQPDTSRDANGCLATPCGKLVCADEPVKPPVCPAIGCAEAPKGCTYQPDTSRDANGCLATPCGKLVCEADPLKPSPQPQPSPTPDICSDVHNITSCNLEREVFKECIRNCDLKFVKAKDLSSHLPIERNGEIVSNIFPSVEFLNDDKAVAIWAEMPYGQHPSTYSIKSRIYSVSSGWSAETTIEANILVGFNDILKMPVSYINAEKPILKIDSTGTAHAFWTTKIDGKIAIKTSRLTTEKWLTPTIVTSEMAGISTVNRVISTPEVAFDTKGKGIMVWLTKSELRYSEYSATNGWSESKTVSPATTLPLHSNMPKIVVDSSGLYTVVWQKNARDLWSIQYSQTNGWSNSIQIDPKFAIVTTEFKAAEFKEYDVYSTADDVVYVVAEQSGLLYLNGGQREYPIQKIFAFKNGTWSTLTESDSEDIKFLTLETQLGRFSDMIKIIYADSSRIIVANTITNDGYLLKEFNLITNEVTHLDGLQSNFKKLEPHVFAHRKDQDFLGGIYNNNAIYYMSYVKVSRGAMVNIVKYNLETKMTSTITDYAYDTDYSANQDYSQPYYYGKILASMSINSKEKFLTVWSQPKFVPRDLSLPWSEVRNIRHLEQN